MLPSSSPALGHPGPAQPAAQFTATDCPVSVPVSGTPVIMGLNQVCHGLQNCEFFANPVLAPTKLLSTRTQPKTPVMIPPPPPPPPNLFSGSYLAQKAPCQTMSGRKSAMCRPKICHVPVDQFWFPSAALCPTQPHSSTHSAPQL
jgi:hypothetical protein